MKREGRLGGNVGDMGVNAANKTVPDCKSDNLGLISRSHMVEEENL